MELLVWHSFYFSMNIMSVKSECIAVNDCNINLNKQSVTKKIETAGPYHIGPIWALNSCHKGVMTLQKNPIKCNMSSSDSIW